MASNKDVKTGTLVRSQVTAEAWSPFFTNATLEQVTAAKISNIANPVTQFKMDHIAEVSSKRGYVINSTE